MHFTEMADTLLILTYGTCFAFLTKMVHFSLDIFKLDDGYIFEGVPFLSTLKAPCLTF